MPAKGLPSALEGALNALIKENPLSAFNIDGRGDNVVVTLRFSTDQPNDTATSLGDSCPSLRHKWRGTRGELAPNKVKSATIHSQHHCFYPLHPVN